MRHTPPTPAVPDAPPDFARMAEEDIDGVFLCDRDLRRRYVNLKAERIAGLPHDALTGRRSFGLTQDVTERRAEERGRFLPDQARRDRALLDPDAFPKSVQRLDGRAAGSFVRVPLPVLDPCTGVDECAAAGGEPPLVVRRRGGVREEAPASSSILRAHTGSEYAPATFARGSGGARDDFFGYAGMARGAARP